MFSGKFALVTGGGSGIGRAIALALSHQQAFCVVLDVNADSANEATEEIRRSGGQGLAVCADVASLSQVSAAFKKIGKITNKLDILVNCAGIYVYSNAVKLEESEWQRCLDVDLKGAWLCSKEAIPMMMAAGGGAIINIASTHPIRAHAQAFPYGVAKGGLLSLTRSMAVDFGEAGIRVNSVCPGLVFSPLMHQYSNQNPDVDIEKWLALQPLAVRIQPEDIANAAVFLASDQARCITGTALIVDCGRTIFSGIRHGH
jgi:NAD(P)-dependent dehydrogenase (short-subunit alcohol dehydrogenase family)